MPLVFALTGCSSFWPLSDELEEAIAAETSSLTPAIHDSAAVVEAARAIIDSPLEAPEDFPLPADAGLGEYVRIALERSPRIHARVRDLEALGMR
ncbi:MAG TPA: hypothetical protein VK116_17685, partial [Planctomycetota bacterium]|nr:hypothetical protein [Planctomycetota bacterium]